MAIPSKNIIVIYDECRRFLSVARDISGVIEFLCQCDWLSEGTEFYLAHEWVSVNKAYGEEWREYFKSCTLDELKEIFDGDFYFQETKLW